MSNNQFGIYILTYPGDFHLSTMLVRSIQYVSPDIPIMIIPGEGFDRDNHPFDVPIMPEPQGFWGRIGNMDRDFWAFQGPFETFLYLDADTICVKSLDSLVKRIKAQEGDFIYVQPWLPDDEWLAVIRNPSHPDYQSYRQDVRSAVGSDALLEFDSEHDFLAHRTFNAGIFASRRLAIKESDLEALNKAEIAFYRSKFSIDDWTWDSKELFFRDQGRLNYLVHKLGIPVFPIAPDVICRSGADAISASFEEVQNDAKDFHIIHWMGSKRPDESFFCAKPLFTIYAYLWANVGKQAGRFVAADYKNLQECTGYSLWKHYYEQDYGSMRFGKRLHSSWRDLKRVWKLSERSLRLLLKRIT